MSTTAVNLTPDRITAEPLSTPSLSLNGPSTDVDVFPQLGSVQHAELVRHLDNVLEHVEDATGLAPADLALLMLPLPNDSKPYITATSLLHGLSEALLEKAWPHKPTWNAQAVFSWIRTNSAKYGYTNTELVRRREQLTAEWNCRTGAWTEIDADALDRARDAVARIHGVTPHEVAQLVRDGPAATFLRELSLPAFGSLYLGAKDDDPDVLAVKCLFLLYSGRSTFYDVTRHHPLWRIIEHRITSPVRGLQTSVPDGGQLRGDLARQAARERRASRISAVG